MIIKIIFFQLIRLYKLPMIQPTAKYYKAC